ncbi:MAG: hypothetical protein AAF236_11160, partial [Verrucomicrobiota bacterium]
MAKKAQIVSEAAPAYRSGLRLTHEDRNLVWQADVLSELGVGGEREVSDLGSLRERLSTKLD